MNQPLLILDTHYLCHRAFHTTKELEWKGRATGVIYGFLKSISVLKDEFQTDRIAFCFEHSHLYRKDLFPDYKKRRHSQERSEAEQDAYRDLKSQILLLYEDYLPFIGFRNVFRFKGMESDDIMAAIALNTETESILVTADHDLYQCLSPLVSIYNPQKQRITNEGTFYQTFLIKPKQWAKVKAITGCQSDEVPGVPGIGEVTALKYLRGELKPDSKAYLTIVSAESKAIVRRNRPLVELPFKDCPVPRIQDDAISEKGWKKVCTALGMKSLLGRPPIATRAMRKITDI